MQTEVGDRCFLRGHRDGPEEVALRKALREPREWGTSWERSSQGRGAAKALR